MRKETLQAQLEVGLRGLGLLRSYPFLEADDVERALDLLTTAAADRARVEIDVVNAREGYAAWSRTYDTLLNPLLLAEQPAIHGVLAAFPPGRALDAACGTGRLTRILIECGHDVDAVDASSAMLEVARVAAPKARYGIAGFEGLPFPDATFDLVVCGLALTHHDSLVAAIGELARVLKPGGRMVTSDVHPLAVATGAHAFFRRADGSRGVVRNELHWHGEYAEAFVRAGLHVLRCLEPRFSDEVLQAFLSKGGLPALENLVGLPYVLIWECARHAR